MIISERILNVLYEFDIDKQCLIITNHDNFINMLTEINTIKKLIYFFDKVNENLKLQS